VTDDYEEQARAWLTRYETDDGVVLDAPTLAALLREVAGPYRTPDAPEPSDDQPSIEEGLKNVLAVLEPYDHADTTRILSAVAALYDLPFFEQNIERKDIES